MSTKISSVDIRTVQTQNAINVHRASVPGFAGILGKKVKDLKFSAHAEARLRSRNISMSPENIRKLESAVSRAESRGSQDSLVLLSDLAFIVNVPNRTVVTAMDGESIKDNVFTNIDSTVIAG